MICHPTFSFFAPLFIITLYCGLEIISNWAIFLKSLIKALSNLIFLKAVIISSIKASNSKANSGIGITGEMVEWKSSRPSDIGFLIRLYYIYVSKIQAVGDSKYQFLPSTWVKPHRLTLLFLWYSFYMKKVLFGLIVLVLLVFFILYFIGHSFDNSSWI